MVSRKNCYLNTVSRKRQSTVLKPLCRVLNASRGAGLTKKKGVCEHEESFGWSPRRDFGCRHSGGCSSHSSDYQRNNFDELYGLYDYADRSSTVPAACCSVGSSWNRGVHDPQRLKGELSNEESIGWSVSRHSGSSNRCCGSSHSSSNLGYRLFYWDRRNSRVRLERKQPDVFMGCYDCDGSKPVSVASCRASVSRHSGLHDLKQLSTPLVFPSEARTLNAPTTSFLYYACVTNSREVSS